MKPLDGQVAVVAGATRGAGRGVARALGEAGALVYCTGRSVPGQPSPYARPETIDETAAMIEAAGGKAKAVRVDHTRETEVEALFARVEREQGRLDVVVDSVAGEDPMMSDWSGPWELDLTNAEAILRQAVLSRVITAKHAMRAMVRGRRGLIVEITENDVLMGSGNVVVQIAKLAHRGLAVILAPYLKAHNVAAIALTPGFLRSEQMLEHFGVTEGTWRDAGAKDPNFLESESPLFVGRAVVALATDPQLMSRSGHLFSSWELGRELGFTDADGRRPDWGMKEIDFSVVPEVLRLLILDGMELQSRWLHTLADRSDRYVARWSPSIRGTVSS
jgi:NAD(P)-dependent dehydrogenase (short-subunit alcohol dehydrogenase family)